MGGEGGEHPVTYHYTLHAPLPALPCTLRPTSPSPPSTLHTPPPPPFTTCPAQLVSLRDCIASLQAGAACNADSDAASSRQRVQQLEGALKAKEKEAEKLRSMRDATAAGSSGEVGRKGVGIYIDPDACAAAGGGAQSEGEGDGERS